MVDLDSVALSVKEERRGRIEAELKKMKIGFCGVKYDCVVWRVSRTRWQVGHRSISLGNEEMTAGAAAIFLSD